VLSATCCAGWAVIAFYRLLLAGLALVPFALLNRDARQELRGITRRQAGQIGMAGILLAGMGAMNVGSSLMFFGLYFLTKKHCQA